MRKRLRKKRHLGEFRQYGFLLAFHVPEERRNDVMDRFIREAIEDNGLQFGGSDHGGFAALHQRRGSATEEHRAKVRAWLEAQPEVSNIQIGLLRDAWHGWSWDVEDSPETDVPLGVRAKYYERAES